jgi:hypothetical protein
MATPEEIHEYQRLMKGRPHVVILGAGATMATIPTGDKNGLRSSVMDGFLEKLGMLDVIKNANLATNSQNLEDIYSELHERAEYEPVRALLDQRIREYFLELEIPDQPTIYDLLLLGLRKKDLVATFNWDPLLLQAYQRTARITKDLPRLAFLHGNVLVGYCPDHKVGGIIYARCPQCGNPFPPGRLLYPIRNKDYAADPYTEDHWRTIRNTMKRAYLVTIFGYSAPKTDSEAIALMKDAWGESHDRELEDFEFIDIRSEDELVASWSEFIHSHHYQVHTSFFDSSLAQFPRRTTVELFDRTMECKFTKPTSPFSPEMNWSEVESLTKRLIEEEQRIGTEEFLCVAAA